MKTKNLVGTNNFSRKKRRTDQEKLALVTLMSLETVDGYPDSVSYLSRKYGVQRKSLYAWQEYFAEGFVLERANKPSKEWHTKSNDPQLLELILNLVTQHPEWPFKRLTQELQKLDHKMSRPTLIKALTTLNLETKEKRYGNAERAWVDSKLERSKELYELLTKFNPGFANTNIWHPEEPRFIVNLLKLDTQSIDPSYFVFAVEGQTLFTEGFLWNGCDVRAIRGWLIRISAKIQAALGPPCTFFAEKKWPFNQIDENLNPTNSKFQKIDGRFLKGFLGISKIVSSRIEKQFRLISDIKFQDELQKDFVLWCNDFNSSPGPYCYPSFHRTPIEGMRGFKAGRTLFELLMSHEPKQ